MHTRPGSPVNLPATPVVCGLCGLAITRRWWHRWWWAAPVCHYRGRDLDQCWRAYAVRVGLDPTTPRPTDTGRVF